MSLSCPCRPILTLCNYSHFAQGRTPNRYTRDIPCAILELSGTIPELYRFLLCAEHKYFQTQNLIIVFVALHCKCYGRISFLVFISKGTCIIHITCRWDFCKMYKTYEPPRDKTNKVSVHPAKTQISLGICPVRVFAVHMKKAWTLCYPLSTQRRL